FPLDFTTEIADEKAMALDMAGFEAELEKQRERARQSWKGDEAVSPLFQQFVESGGTQFLGYRAVHSPARVIGIFTGAQMTPSIGGQGVTAEIVLDQTPFYAESGGQVGDTGTIVSDAGAARVIDTYSPIRGVVVHKIELDFGEIRLNDDVQARVDEERRRRTAANHTATHILHAVLRQTVGPHVKQAGSLVAPDR